MQNFEDGKDGELQLYFLMYHGISVIFSLMRFLKPVRLMHHNNSASLLNS